MLDRKTFTIPVTCPACMGLVILEYAAPLGGHPPRDFSWSCPHVSCDGRGSLTLHGELRAVAAGPPVRPRTNAIDLGVAFLRTQLDLGLTFVALAASASSAERRVSNRASASKSLQAVLKHGPSVLLTQEQHVEIERKIEQLTQAIKNLDVDGG